MEIESSKDFQIAVEGQQHTLTINDPYPEDTGVFLISASNNFGKATSTGMWFKIIKDLLKVYLKVSEESSRTPKNIFLRSSKRFFRYFSIFVLCQVDTKLYCMYS